MEVMLLAGIGAGIVVMLLVNQLAHQVHARRYSADD